MEMLKSRWAQGHFVCVGLDSESEKLPDVAKKYEFDPVAQFNAHIVDATKNFVCAYKPNLAFYVCNGEIGLISLKRTIAYIHEHAPWAPVILDAKVADIGNTNLGYAKMAFEYLKADAITVHPYLGQEALKPFLDQPDKGIIVLCRTSNPGGGEFQDLMIDEEESQMRFYQTVAYRVANFWNQKNNCAVVAGATYPGELAQIRRLVGEMPILIPGVGAQGGDVEATVKAGQDSRGQGMIINSSRGIIFASKGDNFAEKAREETIKLHDMINQFRTAS
jgi:orotidine-5'-phosphate decarboxylase